MKSRVLIFIIGFIVAFGAGYLIWGLDSNGDDTSAPVETAETETNEEEDADDSQAGETTIAEEAMPLVQNNCLSCHAVESLNATGGTTGPDLSNAYNQTEGKHGVPLDEYLQEPTTAVMSTVIEGNPLSDEEREAIVEALRIAAEKQE